MGMTELQGHGAHYFLIKDLLIETDIPGFLCLGLPGQKVRKVSWLGQSRLLRFRG